MDHCARGSGSGYDCAVVGHEVSNAHEEFWNASSIGDGVYRRWHDAVASALLGGFSIAEVTAAERRR